MGELSLQEQLDKLHSDLQTANKHLDLLNSEVQVCLQPLRVAYMYEMYP